MPRSIAIRLITLYQHTLSPDHGWLKVRYPQGYCRFTPTCSEYSKQAYQKYGFFKGSWLGIWRIIRCNPLNKGGEDRIS